MGVDIQELLAKKKVALLAKKLANLNTELPTNTPNANKENETTSEQTEKKKQRKLREKENRKKSKLLEREWLEGQKARAIEIKHTTEPRRKELDDETEESVSTKKEKISVKDMKDDDESLMQLQPSEVEQSLEHKKSGKLRKLNQLQKVADLKLEAPKPELVEVHDATAPDPVFLVHLKATPNTVPIPAHWSLKRKFLDTKKGSEKTLFQLPKFIEDTGIASLRPISHDMNDKSIKKEMRERARPKLNKLHIDYNILKAAFMVHQTKPHLTEHGDIYYEMKEAEASNKIIRAGQPLSPGLLRALGLHNATTATPPPWLSKMQYHGPPPGYPNALIPGVNIPIPENAQWGHGSDQWGKPPVKADGQGIWGDVLGGITTAITPLGWKIKPTIEKDRGELWGKVTQVFKEDDSDDEEDEDDEMAVVKPKSETDSKQVTTQTGDEYSVNLAHYSNVERHDIQTDAILAARSVPVVSKPSTVSDHPDHQLYSVIDQKVSADGKMMYDVSGVTDIDSTGKRKYDAVSSDKMEEFDQELLEAQKALEAEKKKRKTTSTKKSDIF